jgi:hypothetical protein
LLSDEHLENDREELTAHLAYVLENYERREEAPKRAGALL